MQSFYEECVVDHYNYPCGGRIDKIFEENAMGQSFLTAVHQDFVNDMPQWFPMDLKHMCFSYCDFARELNIMAVDKNCEAQILSLVSPTSRFPNSLSLRGKAERFGVCNALLEDCRQHSFGNSDDFIEMFVAVAKFYGEQTFIRMLRYIGLIPDDYRWVYSEIVNRVAEDLCKVRTRCVRFLAFCGCWKQNQAIHADLILKLDNASIDCNGDLLIIEASKHFPLKPVYNSAELSIEDVRNIDSKKNLDSKRRRLDC